MSRLTLSPGGPLLGPDGQPFEGLNADATQIDVPHLAAHVVRYTLPKGDVVKVLVQYSCHCWTSAHDPVHHAGMVQIMDGPRARVQDSKTSLTAVMPGAKNTKGALADPLANSTTSWLAPIHPSGWTALRQRGRLAVDRERLTQNMVTAVLTFNEFPQGSGPRACCDMQNGCQTSAGFLVSGQSIMSAF